MNFAVPCSYCVSGKSIEIPGTNSQAQSLIGLFYAADLLEDFLRVGTGMKW